MNGAEKCNFTRRELTNLLWTGIDASAQQLKDILAERTIFKPISPSNQDSQASL